MGKDQIERLPDNIVAPKDEVILDGPKTKVVKSPMKVEKLRQLQRAVYKFTLT